RRLLRMAEELDLHLLKLPAPESVIARIDLIAKRLADLSDPERQLKPCAVEDIVEISEDALCGFGAEIGFIGLVLNRARICLQHQIKLLLLREFALASRNGAWQIPPGRHPISRRKEGALETIGQFFLLD